MAQRKTSEKEKDQVMPRKRRAHQKSRRGCRNCKLRKVKCDETRPTCEKCVSFGVECNYDAKNGKSGELRMSYDRQVTFAASPPVPAANKSAFTTEKISIGRALCPPMICGDDISSFEFDKESLSRLDRFKSRTVATIGTKAAAHLFGVVAFDLVFAHPYLMHVVQVLTACHDRHLSPNPFSKQTLSEVYHITRAAALFNQKLCKPIQYQDRDGLWATAALLGLLAYSLTDASTPEESWPLVVDEERDPLEWINIAESKTTIWNLVDPLRPDSKFASMKAYTHTFTPFKIPLHGNEGIPNQFVELYKIGEWTNPKVNPYFTAVHILIPLLPIPCERENIVRFLAFMGHMEDEFKDLLRARDPRALLLVAYFYAKVWRSTWWMERRAVLECEAVCLYLERYHADNTLLQEMLLVPKRRCGMAPEVEWVGSDEMLIVRVDSEPIQPSPLTNISLGLMDKANSQFG